ncbi:DUF3618 domain-containing protein [Nonomuraea ferruginea]
MGAAGIVGLFGGAVLVAAVVMLLALVMPAWLAAAIVAVVLLATAAVLGLAKQEAGPAGHPARSQGDDRQREGRHRRGQGGSTPMSETNPGYSDDQYAGDVGSRRATVGTPTDPESINVPVTRGGAAENAHEAELRREPHETFIPEGPEPDDRAEAIHSRAVEEESLRGGGTRVPESTTPYQDRGSIATPLTDRARRAAVSGDEEEQVRESIRETRRELGETVSALAHKVDVKSRAAEAAESAKERAAAMVGTAKAKAAEMSGTAKARVERDGRHREDQSGRDGRDRQSQGGRDVRQGTRTEGQGTGERRRQRLPAAGPGIRGRRRGGRADPPPCRPAPPGSMT